MAKEVEHYPDGSEIKRFPRWVYPGDKPSISGERRHSHNGVLVNNEDELKAALTSFGDVETTEEKPKGWKNK